MDWMRMLAYITGTVDQELLLRNEYLATENRILRAQLRGRLLLSDAERATHCARTRSPGCTLGQREYRLGLRSNRRRAGQSGLYPVGRDCGKHPPAQQPSPGPGTQAQHDLETLYPCAYGRSRRDRFFHCGGTDPTRVGHILCAVLYPFREPSR